MLYYKLIKITINVLSLAKIVLNIIIEYHGFVNLININKSLFFTLENHYLTIFLILNKNF